MAKKPPTVKLMPYPYLDRPRWISWQTSGGGCLICVANEAVGVVPIDTIFPSGDEAPPAHFHCQCGLQSEDPDYDQWQDESPDPDEMFDPNQMDANQTAGENDTPPTPKHKITFPKTITMNNKPTTIHIIRRTNQPITPIHITRTK